MSSNADSQPDLGSGQSPPTVTDPSAMPTPTYAVPDWFFSDNVKTAAQLSAIKPKIFLADLPNKCTGNEGLKPGYTSDEESAFTVSRQTFLSARDTIAACLVRDSQGRLPTHSTGIFISFETKAPSDVPVEYVDALAKEFGATLVTLTLHDLQTLAATYQDQTPAELQQAFDKYSRKGESRDCNDERHPSYELVWHYFGNRCGENAGDAAKERSKQAFATILGIQERDGAPAVNKDSAQSRQQPLIIHLAKAQLLTGKSQGIRLVTRLAKAISQERKVGNPVLLVVTRHVPWHLAESNPLPTESGIAASAMFSINHLVIPAALDPAKDSSRQVSAAFIDNLKFLLRFYARHSFDPATLLPKTKWKLELDDNIGDLAEGDTELLESVARQTRGRALDKQNLGVEDIAQVVNQVVTSKQIEAGTYNLTTGPKDAGDGEGLKTSGEDDDDSETSSDSEDDSETSSEAHNLNKYEQALRGSIVTVEQLQDTKYEDVILPDDIKDIMKQLILLSRMKIDVESSFLMSAVQISAALLYGPPGTGKTHLSRAIANSLGSNMLALDSATMTSKYVGETEKYIKAAFSLARKYAPCILFLDEVDALFYRRSSNDKSWQRSALTQFLQEVDGLQGGLPGAPFVLVATNRPMDLDTAFLRRLPQKIHFELPNEAARAQILRVLLKKEDLHSDVDIDHLATLTNGYSGSDLKNLCAEAALLWILEISQTEAKEAARKADAAKSPCNDSGSEVTETTASKAAAGGGHDKDDDENNKANTDQSTDATAAKSEQETAQEIRKKEKLVRKEARALKRKKKEEMKAAEALYMAKFTKVCLTNAIFEKALQRMRPTVSREAIREIEKFAELYSDQ